MLDAEAPAFETGRPPRAGESLPGYLLALDELNQLDAGRTLRLTRRYAAGPSKATRPAAFVGAKTVDLEKVTQLVGNVTGPELERLTAIPVLRWLYRGDDHVTLRLAAPAFRLCPACIRERHISFASLFSDVDGCAEHGLALVRRCSCGEPILPLVGQERPFTCHAIGCETRYEDLVGRPLTDDERRRCLERTAVYADLQGYAATAPRPAPSARALAASLRTLYERLTPVPAERWKVTDKPGLAAVVTALAVTRSSARDLQVLLLGFAPSGRALPVPGPGGCPNPACISRSSRNPRPIIRYAGESQCRMCGTRFTRDRVLFSFDEQPGYRAGLGARNDARLARHRVRLAALCEEWIERDRSITRGSALSAVGVTPHSVPHLSERAGLVAIISAAQARQRERRLAHAQKALSAVDPNDAPLRLRIEVLAMSHVMGVGAACKKYRVVRSRFYRWRTAQQRGGIDGLKATCRSSGRRRN